MPVPSEATKPRPGYETVFSVSAYYDGPRAGMANFRGVPHIYECIFDEKCDQYSDWYLLMPVGPELLALEMTNWRIFLKWREAFDAGQTTLATHPALPEDKTRYEETRRTLEQAIELAKPQAIRVRGHFDILGEPTTHRDVHTRWQVKWSQSTGPA